MFNIGTGELIVIALIALIVLGPDKLPQAARQVGHFTAEARKIANGFRQEMKSAMDEVADTAKVDDGQRTDRTLTQAPTTAQPIDVEPVEARPLNPPPGTSANGTAPVNGNGSAPAEDGADRAADPGAADDQARS